MVTKICKTCDKELDINCFSKHKAEKDGLRCQCKECCNAYFKIWHDKNRERELARTKKWKEDNKEHCEKYVEDNKVRRSAYFKKHNEENKDRLIQYRIDNKDKRMAYNRNYYLKNSDMLKENVKIYNSENREKCNILKQRYEARKHKLPSTLTTAQWEQVKLYFNNKCCYCGKELPLEQEHLLAVLKGGEYTHNNIIPSCKSCNCSKGAKDFFAWYPKHKYYSKKREKIILDFLGYQNKVQQFTLAI